MNKYNKTVYRLCDYIKFMYDNNYPMQNLNESINKILRIHNYKKSEIKILLSMLLFYIDHSKNDLDEDYKNNCILPLIYQLKKLVFENGTL